MRSPMRLACVCTTVPAIVIFVLPRNAISQEEGWTIGLSEGMLRVFQGFNTMLIQGC